MFSSISGLTQYFPFHTQKTWEEIHAEREAKLDPDKLKRVKQLMGSKENNFCTAGSGQIELSRKEEYLVLKECPDELIHVTQEWQKSLGVANSALIKTREEVEIINKKILDEQNSFEGKLVRNYPKTYLSLSVVSLVASLSIRFFFIDMEKAAELQSFVIYPLDTPWPFF